MERNVGAATIDLVHGNITREEVDAIVNAANSTLLGGGGVDGAIHQAGGRKILKECKQIVARQGQLPTGQAVITGAGCMPSRHVIHTVGPVYGHTKQDAELLASCYRESLKLVVDNTLRSVAFPAISAGVYGYPMEEAAEVALKTTISVMEEGAPIVLVRFVLFSEAALRTYETVLARLLP